MRRLTTNNPEDNIETALNFYYVKDHETWVRGGGDAPDYPDVSLFDWIKKIINQFCPDSFDMRSDKNLNYDLADTLMEGTETMEGVIAHLYMSAWTHAELRERLMKYENTGINPDEISVSKWIPLTEENMPDVGDDILLTVDVAGHGITGKGIRYTTDSWLMDGQKITADAIKAWMPMPEPYEENV